MTPAETPAAPPRRPGADRLFAAGMLVFLAGFALIFVSTLFLASPVETARSSLAVSQHGSLVYVSPLWFGLGWLLVFVGGLVILAGAIASYLESRRSVPPGSS